MPEKPDSSQLDLWQDAAPENKSLSTPKTEHPSSNQPDTPFELELTGNHSPQKSLEADFAERHPRKILIADDIELNRTIIGTMLKKLGYEYLEATNGKDALDLHNSERFDYIFMDLDMPEMSGIEAAAAIRAEEKRHSRPITEIIAVTANVSDKTRADSANVGMNGYLEKPITAIRVKKQLTDSWPRIKARRERAAKKAKLH